jgi:hypothetical protein
MRLPVPSERHHRLQRRLQVGVGRAEDADVVGGGDRQHHEVHSERHVHALLLCLLDRPRLRVPQRSLHDGDPIPLPGALLPLVGGVADRIARRVRATSVDADTGQLPAASAARLDQPARQP